MAQLEETFYLNKPRPEIPESRNPFATVSEIEDDFEFESEVLEEGLLRALIKIIKRSPIVRIGRYRLQPPPPVHVDKDITLLGDKLANKPTFLKLFDTIQYNLKYDGRVNLHWLFWLSGERGLVPSTKDVTEAILIAGCKDKQEYEIRAESPKFEMLRPLAFLEAQNMLGTWT